MEIFKASFEQAPQSRGPQSAQSAQPQRVEAKQEAQKVPEEEGKLAPTKEQLEDLTQKLNVQMEALSTNVRFGYNDKIEAMYVNVTEKDTGKIIRKIPTDEIMRLSEHMREAVGMIFDNRA